MIRRILTGAVFLVIVAATAWATWWIIKLPKPTPVVVKPDSPAKVDRILKEEDITRIELTAKAHERLGIQTAAVAKKTLPRRLSYAGEAVIPAGRTILVTAPLGGLLKAPGKGMPAAGSVVRKGQEMLVLLPLLTPEARATLSTQRVDAEGLVKNARAARDGAKITLTRAERVQREAGGSRRAVDDAQILVDVAQKTLDAAIARRDLLVQVAGDIDKGTADSLTIDAPESGLVRAITALPGQTVPMGAALFEIVNLSRIWVRVPVLVGDLDAIARDQPASVGSLVDRAGSPTRLATPVAAPPTANALAGSVDLYYEMDNPSPPLAPGERVGVTLTQRGEGRLTLEQRKKAKLPPEDEPDSLVVPWSAVVFDIHGGTWVYEQAEARTYVRRRVRVWRVEGGDAVLASGPAVGTPVVSEGAIELLGTEVGFSK